MGTPTTTSAEPTVYTVPEVAEILGCSTASVYRLLATDQLDHFRIGTKYGLRVSHSALSTYINGAAS